MSNQRSIAIAFGVSEAAVSKWAARGCPVHLGPAAVRAWRAANLRPRAAGAVRRRRGGADEAGPVLEALQRHAAVVHKALSTGSAPDRTAVANLRLAMRRVALTIRPSVQIPTEVWQYLCGDLLAAFGELARSGGLGQAVDPAGDLLGPAHAPPLTDAQADEVGNVYWQFAAGELVLCEASS